MSLSIEQLEKLSDLFMDLAKGLFLAALAVPAITPVVTLLTSLRISITGLVFLYLSLKTIELKEVIK